MVKDYKYLLFDWDGCLADTMAVWIRAYAKTYKMYGLDVSDTDIAEKSMGKKYPPAEYGIADIEMFVRRLLDNVDKEMGQAGLSEGAKDMLGNMNLAGKKMAIVSSSRRQFIERTLLMEQAENYFKFIIDINDVARLKPDPEGIIKALERFGALPEEVVMIGDSHNDILAGQNANMATILYYPKSHESLYSAEYIKSFKPTRIIRDFRELIM
jgi:pyrophosphatase PpaX